MPIDKSMLAMMLMSNAPALLQTLKNTVSPNTFNKANDLITNRQYDAPGVGAEIAKKASVIGTDGSSLVSNNLLDSATDLAVNAMTTQQSLPSQGATDWDAYTLGSLMSSGQANDIADTLKNPDGTETKYALNSAAAMLMNGLPTDEQIPNPNTGMSALDWAYADLEQMPNSTARHNLARNLAQRSNASYGLKNFFNDNFRK